MAETPESPTRAAETTLAGELLAILVDSYGKGAGKVGVHIIEDSVVCFLDDLQLQPNEEFLISEGQEAAVVEIRTRYQQAIESTFSAAVERATGRRVISFVSMTKLDPNYAVEVFRLGPKAERGEDPRSA